MVSPRRFDAAAIVLLFRKGCGSTAPGRLNKKCPLSHVAREGAELRRLLVSSRARLGITPERYRHPPQRWNINPHPNVLESHGLGSFGPARQQTPLLQSALEQQPWAPFSSILGMQTPSQSRYSSPQTHVPSRQMWSHGQQVSPQVALSVSHMQTPASEQNCPSEQQCPLQHAPEQHSTSAEQLLPFSWHGTQ